MAVWTLSCLSKEGSIRLLLNTIESTTMCDREAWRLQQHISENCKGLQRPRLIALIAIKMAPRKFVQTFFVLTFFINRANRIIFFWIEGFPTLHKPKQFRRPKLCQLFDSIGSLYIGKVSRCVYVCSKASKVTHVNQD